jgi:hypothetical protein
VGNFFIYSAARRLCRVVGSPTIRHGSRQSVIVMLTYDNIETSFKLGVVHRVLRSGNIILEKKFKITQAQAVLGLLS